MSDDARTVGELTAGLKLERRDKWVHDLAEEVARTIGIHTERHPIVGLMEPDARRGALVSTHIEDGKWTVQIDPHLAKSFTKREMEAMLVHELTHTQQSLEMRRDHPGESEREADLAMARAYGAKTALDIFRKIDRVQQENGVPMNSVEREKWRAREQAIIDAFPEEHLSLEGKATLRAGTLNIALGKLNETFADPAIHNTYAYQGALSDPRMPSLEDIRAVLTPLHQLPGDSQSHGFSPSALPVDKSLKLS